jgi:starch-binding outer membrane protein, SusD/RagB family
MNRYKIFLLLSATLIFSSCKKILEQEPNSAPDSSKFWQTTADFEAATLGNYSLLRSALTNGNFNVVFGDIAMRISSAGDFESRVKGRNLAGTFPAVISWSNFYKSISQSNLVIQRVTERLPKISGQQGLPLKRNMGEAYFLRALAYFYITRIWGEVPIETVSFDNPLLAEQKPREPVSKVLDQISADIVQALELLKSASISSGDRSIRASYYSAKALEAHLNIWRARMEDVKNLTTNQTYLDKAKAAIDEIKTSSLFSLVNVASYKDAVKKQSTESIFEITIDESKGEGSTSHFAVDAISAYRLDPGKTALYQGTGVYSGFTGNQNNIRVPLEFVTKFYGTSRTTDIRMPLLYDEFSGASSRAQDFVLRKFDNFIYRDPVLRTTPVMSHPIVVFRYADILLLEAEYYLYKGQAGNALPILNSFRARYNNAPLASATLTNYFAERVKELHFEGHSYYDMLRTRLYVGNVDPYNGFDDAGFKKEAFYFPVPVSMFVNNPYMKQTQFWLGRL